MNSNTLIPVSYHTKKNKQKVYVAYNILRLNLKHNVSFMLLLVFLFMMNTRINAQENTSIYNKINVLKNLFSRADTLSPFTDTIDNIETITKINIDISIKLKDILSLSEVVKLDIDSLLQHPFLGLIHSSDHRLWIFSWSENTGGTWRSNLNLIHYRTEANKPKVVYKPINDETDLENMDDKIDFFSNGSGFGEIYKLKVKDRDLYLCMGYGVSCSTCIYQTAFVIELTKDSINFDYPAFPSGNSKNKKTNSDQSNSYYILNARMDDIKMFEYNPKSQILNITYLTDDLTPITSEKQKKITSKLIFNGTSFIAK